MEQLTISQKVEYLLGHHLDWLGVHSKVENKAPYPKDPYIFPEKFVEDLQKHGTSDAFIGEMMKRPKFKGLKALWRGDYRYVSIVTVLFLIYIIISAIVTVVLIFC